MPRNEMLAAALTKLAHAIEVSSSAPVIGMQVIASNDGTSRNVTGVSINVTAGPGSGSVTGMSVSVTSGQNTLEKNLIRELLEAATAVREGKAAKSWIDSLLLRVRDLGNRALDSAVEGAAAAATAIFIGA
ncbi:hypothetical protein [Hyphomicrobium sp. CS1GBMeth3]|uniref:hypothetical protein n=1 Tax=Hyphomicrobium sp. CS1GBMeth3 TaxID=1892845 RepID=UPI000ADC6BA0|nr:hypothetical protein [Hyphomicrobium sp. CS1GBMeth3]